MKHWIIWLFFIILRSPLFAQYSDDDYPMVGKRMPEIEIKNIADYALKSAKVSQFKGKWLILDFWNKGCTACIHSFPKVNELQRKYADRVQIVLVGLEDAEEQIRPMYAKFKEKLKLQLVHAFDSLLFKRLDIYSCPHVVIVDTLGIVRVVTSELNPESLKNLLDGRQSVWLPTYFRQHDTVRRTGEINIDINKPLFLNNNGGSDTSFLFRSLLAKWKPGMPYYLGSILKNDIRHGSFQIAGATMKKLYLFAYAGKYLWSEREKEYGQIYPEPILELKDSSLFHADFKTGDNVFCYSYVFAPNSITEKGLKDILRSQLDAFCKITSSFETRNMPYWSLEIANGDLANRLRSNGDSTYYKELPHAKIDAKNMPISKLIGRFYANLSTPLPFIDKTGLNTNIDISLDCILSDINSIKEALNKYGLDLQIRYKDMQVIVLCDSH